MFHSLEKLFGRRKPSLEEADIKGSVERYLREELDTYDLDCERIEGGSVWIRVSEVLLQQEVYLLEIGLKEQLNSEVNFKLKQLKVRVG